MSKPNTAAVNNVLPLTEVKTDPLAEMAKRIKELEAQNEVLKTQSKVGGTISCKVSEKGALSIYGLGRFPVTLYIGQFERLMQAMRKVLAFVEANADKFQRKTA